MHSEIFIHPKAIVDEEVSIGANTKIWAHAHILKGAVIGENCNIADNVFIEGGAVIGNNVTIKNNCSIWNGVHIQDEVFIGPSVIFTNDRFPRSPRMPEVKERYQKEEHWLQRTLVKKGVSIGAGAIILPNLTIAPYTSIAAGALVSKSTVEHALMLGSPARLHGYVCTCGYRLIAGKCPECHKNYPELRD
jgi:UDP-2-acetamido-3-amino-2,3-dideoxy-glucuronate N-acetyltransferase